MWTVFKVFIKFVTILFLLYAFVAIRHGDLCSWTRDWTCTPCIRKWSLNKWTVRKASPSSLEWASPPVWRLKQPSGNCWRKCRYTLAEWVGGSLCMHPGPCRVGCSWGMGGQEATRREQAVHQLSLNHHAPDRNSKETVNSDLKAGL